MKADGALGVARGVNDLGWVVVEADTAAVGEGFVGWCSFWRWHADPCGLFGHDLEQGEIVLVEKDGSAGEAILV